MRAGLTTIHVVVSVLCLAGTAVRPAPAENETRSQPTAGAVGRDNASLATVGVAGTRAEPPTVGRSSSATTKRITKSASPPAAPVTPRPLSVFHPTYPHHDGPVSGCDLEVQECGAGRAFNDSSAAGPLRPGRPDVFSSLVRPRRETPRPLPLPLEVGERFVNELLLLYNNPEQLRALLTLTSSAHASEWLTFLGSYEDCEARRHVIFTCVQNSCTSWDLKALRYTADVFVENVLGVEIAPPALYVLVGLKNPATHTSGIIRVPVANAGLLDASYNLVRSAFERLGIQSSLPQTLAAWRDRFPSLYARPPTSLERQPAPALWQIRHPRPEGPALL